MEWILQGGRRLYGKSFIDGSDDAWWTVNLDTFLFVFSALSFSQLCISVAFRAITFVLPMESSIFEENVSEAARFLSLIVGTSNQRRSNLKFKRVYKCNNFFPPKPLFTKGKRDGLSRY